MMEGSPNWWSMNNMQYPPSHQPSTFLSSPLSLSPHQYLPHDHDYQSSSSLDLNSLVDHNHDFPQSWSQLLLGGLYNSEEDRLGGQSHFQYKKLENWEEERIIDPSLRVSIVDVKQEVNQNSQLYGHEEEVDQFQACRPASNWSQVIPVSSPIRSCITTLDFSSSKPDGRNQHQDPSSECNSTGIGRVPKKARVQSSSTQPPLKVRKEKLIDRITALHQLVSPFGKTDTASVLLEAIGYIRFLQSQIEALSSPYLGSGSGNMSLQQYSVQGERGCNYIFDEEHGQGAQEGVKDLRSRGLCLVPVSCTHHVGNDNNGAQYFWASAIGGGF